MSSKKKEEAPPAKKKRQPKVQPKREPFHKRYGHISDDEENSSAEGRVAAKKFAALVGVCVSVSVDAAQPTTTTEKDEMKHPQIVANMTGYMQSIIFALYFDAEALKAPMEESEITDAFRLDKSLAMAAMDKETMFAAFLETHKKNLYLALQRTKFKTKTPISLFHAELFKCHELHRVDVKTAPKGAVNVWSNEAFKADVACSRLNIVPAYLLGTKEYEAKLKAPDAFSVYVTRDQADFLCMCHTIYHFHHYARAIACATAPDGVTEDALSFVNAWDRVVGGLVDEVHVWQWNGMAPFVKLTVQLRDTLQATCEWVGTK
jgi:hypothetical protein